MNLRCISPADFPQPVQRLQSRHPVILPPFDCRDGIFFRQAIVILYGIDIPIGLGGLAPFMKIGITFQPHAPVGDGRHDAIWTRRRCRDLAQIMGGRAGRQDDRMPESDLLREFGIRRGQVNGDAPGGPIRFHPTGQRAVGGIMQACIRPHDPAVKRPRRRGADAEQPLQGRRHIGHGQGCAIGKTDTVAQGEHPCAPVIQPFGHGLRQVGHNLRPGRAFQLGIGQQAIIHDAHKLHVLAAVIDLRVQCPGCTDRCQPQCAATVGTALRAIGRTGGQAVQRHPQQEEKDRARCLP